LDITILWGKKILESWVLTSFYVEILLVVHACAAFGLWKRLFIVKSFEKELCADVM
jgi:hypothetical protein